MKEFDFEQLDEIEIINEILIDAAKKKANLIYFEPVKGGPIKIKMCIEGVVSVYGLIPYKYKNSIVSRIKIMSGLNTIEETLPQDGMFKFKIGEKFLGVNVNCMPIDTEEKIIIRLDDEWFENIDFSNITTKKYNAYLEYKKVKYIKYIFIICAFLLGMVTADMDSNYVATYFCGLLFLSFALFINSSSSEAKLSMYIYEIVVFGIMLIPKIIKILNHPIMTDNPTNIIIFLILGILFIVIGMILLPLHNIEKTRYNKFRYNKYYLIISLCTLLIGIAIIQLLPYIYGIEL